MQTDTYANLVTRIQSLCGATLSTSELARVKTFINGRARAIFLRSDYWPRRLVVGELRPCSSTGLVAFEAGTMSEVDEFLKIHKTSPYGNASAQEFEFYVTGSGAQLIGYPAAGNFGEADMGDSDSWPALTAQNAYWFTLNNSDSDFVAAGGFPGVGAVVGNRFSLSGVVLADGSWGDASGYNTTHEFTYVDTTSVRNEASIVFDAPTIDTANTDISVSIEGVYVTYRKQLTDTFGDGSGETTTIPGEWFDAMAHGSYADWLRSEGQNEKAVVEEGVAEARLLLELEKIDRQHIGDSVAKRMRTHLNMQLRH